MAIIDNTLASKVDTFDASVPLARAAAIRSADMEARQNQFKLIQAELGAEARGLQAFVNTPEFPERWAQATDRLAQKGVLPPQMHQQLRNTPSPLMLKSIIHSTEDPALSFRKQEAGREQANADRSFGLKERELAREQANTDRNFGLKERQVAVEESLAKKKEAGLSDTVAQRKEAAAAAGLAPDHPAYQGFILTNKMPREDAQPLSATDKKAILEADEAVLSNQAAIDSLKRATALSDDAFTGPTAGTRGYLASFLGKSSDWGKSGIATENLTNEVMTNALGQLKAIFGGAPTEGERKVLMDMQGSVSKSPEVRKEIYERAIGLAEKRLEFNKRRSDELRGGQFYKPQGSISRAPVKQTQGISQEEYNKLPRGAEFTAPDGTQRVKP
jgi:hypothetical protein